MDALPLHPKIVHLPIALAVLMPLITAGVLVAWWRGALPRRTWWIAVALQTVLFAAGLYARHTGEADEERVEDVVGGAALEAHEEAADAFIIGAGATLLLVGAAALVRPERVARGVATGAVVATLVGLGLGYRVGEAGGRLVYRDGAAAAFTAGGGTTAPPAATRAHDDDDD